MNKTLKKIVSVMLVILMCMTAAPLDGFVGLDLGLDFTASATGSSLTDQFTLGTGVYGTLKSDTGVLTISGSGAMKNYSNYSDSTASPLKGNTYIKEVVFEDGVTTVGDSAFTGCTSLKKVTLSDTVTSIGTYVFMSCSSFEEIHIGKAVKSIGASALDTGSESTPLLKTITVDSENPNYTAVDNVLYTKDMKTVVRYAPAKTETTYTFPDTVNKISGHAFYGARNLKSIAIPEGVTEIYGETFYDCKSLETVTFPSTLKKIHGYNAFWGCSSLTSVTLPEGFTEIGSQTFLKCTKLKTVNLPDSLTTIAAHAFSNCNALTDIKIPANVTSLGRSCAFYNCLSLTSIEIPEGITEIPYGTFEYCYALKSVTIPSTVTKIAEFAFYGCNVLETVNYNGSQTMWNNISIDDTSSSGETTGVNDKLRNATINYACKDEDKLGENIWYSFDETTGAVSLVGSGDTYDYYTSTDASPLYSSMGKIKSVTIGEGITGIGDFVFYGCSKLAELSLPSTLETIGKYSFYKHALTEITIPDSVTSIVDYAFYGEKLTKLHIGKGLTTFNQNMVGTSPITTLTVSEDNPSFTAKDNVLFNKDVTEYVYFPLGITEHTIPGTITTLPEGAFEHRSKLEKITIPASIAIIPKQAFMYCTALKEVTISASTTEIQSYAFYEDTNLTDVYYGGTKMQWKKVQISSNNDPLNSATIHYTNPESQKLGENVYYEIDEATGELLVYGSGEMYDSTDTLHNNETIKSITVEEGVTNIGMHVFRDLTNLSSVTLPSSLETIKSSAFADCTSLKEIVLPEGLKAIKSNAFEGSGLETITIPASVTDLSVGIFTAFPDCKNLKEINVAEGSTTYSSVGGVVFNADKTKLIYYPPYKDATEYTVPNTVETIGKGAFYDCQNLQKVTLREGVKRIISEAFRSSKSLKEIYLPNSLKEVEDDAFELCEALNVHYNGTLTEWNKIKIDTTDSDAADNGNARLLNATKSFKMGDNATLTFYPAEKKIVVSGTGKMPGDYEGIASLDPVSVVVEDGITTIGNYAFKSCTSLKSIKLGKDIGGICTGAFAGCTSLTDIDFGGTQVILTMAFSNTGIKNLVIPDSVSSIADYAFDNCSSLETVTIEKGANGLSANVFNGCSALKSITVDKDNKSYCSVDGVLYNKKMTRVVLYPAGKTDKEYTMPETITWNDTYAFYGAKNLEKVTLSNGMTSIAANSFEGCTSLNEVVLPTKLKRIDAYAFKNCSALTEIHLPATITTINANAFVGSGLIDIYYDGAKATWESAVTCNDTTANAATMHFSFADEDRIGDNVYYRWADEEKTRLIIAGTGATYNYDINLDRVNWSPFRTNTNIKSVTIGEGVTTIGNTMFKGCENLEEVTLPTTLTSIGDYAFDFTKIKEVTLPSKLETIGECAFVYCAGLKSIVIPDSVTTIGSSAFANCSSLETVTIGKGLTYTDASALGSAFSSSSLKSITVSEENAALVAVDGVLFSKDKKTLVCYPQAKAGATYVVPETVTTIFDSAFFGTKNLRRVELHNTKVETIGISAFASNGGGEDSIQTITLPSTLKTIGAYAFDICYALTDVYFYGTQAQWSAVSIGSDNGMLTGEDADEYGFTPATIHCIQTGQLGENVYYTLNSWDGIVNITGTGDMYNYADYSKTPFFEYKDKIKSVTIDEGVTSVGEWVFGQNTSLESVTLSSTVKTIKFSAFAGCSSLKSIVIPEGVETIETHAFQVSGLQSITLPASLTSVSWFSFSQSKLDTITVSADSKTYKSVGNVLLSKDGKTLILYPAYKLGTEYTIPEGVTTIAANAFGSVQYLKTLTLYGVTEIKDSAFYNGVTQINVDTSLKTVGDSVFDGKCKVTDIYFKGTTAQWDSIEKGEENDFTNITIHFEESGQIGESVFYHLDYNTGVVTITGTGATYNYDNGDNLSPFYNNKSIKSVVVSDGVTSLGDFMFFRASNLESVSLPDSFETLGAAPFAFCKKFKTITVGENNENFKVVDAVLFNKDMTQLVLYPAALTATEYTTPEGLEQINTYAFACANSLEKVTISKNVTMIDEGAFASCSNLKTVYLPSTISTIKSYAFNVCPLTDVYFDMTEAEAAKISIDSDNDEIDEATFHFAYDGKLGDNVYYKLDTATGELKITGTGDMYDYEFFGDNQSPFYGKESIKSVTIGEGVTSVGERTFYNCPYLATVTFPTTLKKIGLNAFTSSGLTSLTIPGNVETIAEYAFNNCGNLTTVTISNGVKTIGDYAFNNCSKLENITISESVQSIGRDVFADCLALTSITVDANNKNYASVDGVLFNKAKTTLICYPAGKTDESYTVPAGVTAIEDSAFYNAKNIKSITMTNDVRTVGASAFYLCENLKSIMLSDKIEEISAGAFFRCTALTDVYYDGTEDQWNAITIERDNAPLTNATIHYAKIKIGDNVFASFDEATGTLTLSGTGSTYGYTDMESSERGYSPFYGATNIKSVVIGEGITRIGQALFYNTSVESITFPTNELTLSHYSFEQTALKSISIPSNVTTIGIGAFESCTDLKTVTLAKGVETIGMYAFMATAIETIDIPDSVTQIGDGAFAGCLLLTEVNVDKDNEYYCSVDGVLFDKGKTQLIAYPAGLTATEYTTPEGLEQINTYAFTYATYLEKITISKDVSIIDMGAFMLCSSLKIVSLPSTISQIGSYAFYYCPLTDIYFDMSQEEAKSVRINGDNSEIFNANIHFAYDGKIGDNVYYKLDETTGALTIFGTGDTYDYTNSNLSPFCNNDNVKSVTIDEGVTSVGDHLFGGCTELTSVTLPSTLKKIGEYAFHKCGFESLAIPGKVETIGDYAFNECWYLATVTISNGVKTIGDYAFSDCSQLENITLPESLESIGDYVFLNCYDLTAINVDENNKNYASVDGVLFNKDKTTLVLYPQAKADESYSVPESVTAIADRAFYQASDLKSITMSNNVKTIGEWAFMYCLSLESITLSNQITTIPDGAFTLCSALKSIDIPESVTTIGDYAFSYCSALTDVYYDGTEDQWNVITINTGNDPLTNATMHFTISNQIGDNVFFTFDEATGAVTITGTGKTYDYDGSEKTSPFEGREDIKSVTISDGVTSIGDRLFVYCTNLESVTLPDSIESIGTAAFLACSSLKALTLPSKLKTIGGYALAGTGLTSITIPASVTSIGDEAISGNSYMTEIIVSADNKNYCSVDGVLFNKDKTTLICYPIAKSTEDYTVPATVTTISAGAFTYASKLKALRLPSGLKTIEDQAFYPHNISDIYFDGTEEEWNNNVTVGELNNFGDNVTMHFKTAHNHDFTGTIKNNGDGTHSYKCTGCEDYGTPVAHNAWDNGKVTTPATHLKEGVKTFTCACGATKTEPVAKLTAHEWDNGKVTTPATHLKEGVKTFTCACGETKTEPVAKLAEHSYIDNVVAPTCTEQGYTTHTCACGDSYTDTYVEATGHHFENGSCTSCGASDPNYNPSEGCDCMCHSSSKFVQFFYKIIRWFWKIFKIHKSCDCGIAHY